ncbi:MAG: hypothetical protein R3179_10245, partial [Sedimenticolaceae bacterium]|nr:hypothetical protein [Sedimenticolaceae bacterium]
SALLSAAEATWPEDPPRTLGALAGKFEGAAADQVMLLDRALYAGENSKWNGNALSEAVRNAWPDPRHEKSDGEEILDPLYPRR